MTEPASAPVMTPSSSLPAVNGTVNGASNGLIQEIKANSNTNKRSLDYEPDDSHRETKRRDAQLLGAKGLQRVRFILLDEEGKQTKRIHIFKFLSNREGSVAADDECKFDLLRFTFERMLEVIGVEEDVAGDLQYSALLPCQHVIDVSTKNGWRHAIKDLDRWMSRLFVTEEAEAVILGPGCFIAREDTPEPEDATKAAQDCMDRSISDTELVHGCKSLHELRDTTRWKEVCELFCHPPNDMDGVKVPGVAVQLSPKLMIATANALSVPQEEMQTSIWAPKDYSKQLFLLTMRSLSWTVSDICFTMHSGLGEADMTNFEQDYHMKCDCFSPLLKNIRSVAPRRGLNAIVAADRDELNDVAQMAQTLYNDDLQALFKHSMLPMIFSDGQLTNVFSDYELDPKELIAKYRNMSEAGAEDANGQEYRAGGLERVIIMMEAKDMDSRELLEAICSPEAVLSDVKGQNMSASDVFADIFATDKVENLFHGDSSELKEPETWSRDGTATEHE